MPTASHWKIRDMASRKAYFVRVKYGTDETALDQVFGFMKEHRIKPAFCRIVETGGRFINMSFMDYIIRGPAS